MSNRTCLRIYRADNQDHNQLSYHVGDSLRRLWVRRTSYTSDEWVCPINPPVATADGKTIIPEYQTASAADQAEQHMPSPLINYCRAHPTLQDPSDDPNLAVVRLPPFIDLNTLPRHYWPDGSRIRDHLSTPRRPLKSQKNAFGASGHKTARN